MISLIDGSVSATDGYEATTALRAQGITVPIIALTGNALDEDQRKFIHCGADEVLTKPVRREHLDTIVGRFRNPHG